MKYSKKLLLIILGILIGIISVEIMLRILPLSLTNIDFSLQNEERIFSSTRGMKFKPYLERVWTGLGEPTIWHFNELGYRERPIQLNKPKNIFRIVVIGDSVTMGFGVEDFESYPRRLEQILKPKTVNPNMTHFEVLNLGIQGYSTNSYLAVLKEDVTKMKPDLVIIGFYSNDPAEAEASRVDNNYFVLKSIPDLLPFSLNQVFKEKSRFYLLILGRYYSFIERYQKEYKPSEETLNKEWDGINKDLEEIKNVTDRQKIKLVLLGIPNPKEEVVTDVLSERQKRLKKIAIDSEIIYFDLLDNLRKSSDINSLYLDDLNDHFSPKGNEYAAGAIANFLWDKNLVPKNE